MQKSTLALKSTVTRRPAADPVDQPERLSQAAHHEAVENAAVTATEPATAEQTEQATKPKADPHAVQSLFLVGNLGRVVSVFTVNGIRLTGKLKQFDQFTLLLQGYDGIPSLVFKHAVTTIASAPANDRHE